MAWRLPVMCLQANLEGGRTTDNCCVLCEKSLPSVCNTSLRCPSCIWGHGMWRTVGQMVGIKVPLYAVTVAPTGKRHITMVF